MNSQTDLNIQSYTKEFEYNYYKVVKDSAYIKNEWGKKGDGFKKFTLYNDTTPIVASNHTNLSK